MSYKYDGDIAEISVTQTAFGKFVGCSQPKINQMSFNDELVRDETNPNGRIMLAASLRGYYLSSKPTGDGVNYWKEKARREQVNRKIDEIKLRKMKGELYDVETVEQAIFEILAILRTHLTALPAKFSTQLENKPRDEIHKLLTAEIDERLDELSRSFDKAFPDKLRFAD